MLELEPVAPVPVCLGRLKNLRVQCSLSGAAGSISSAHPHVRLTGRGVRVGGSTESRNPPPLGSSHGSLGCFLFFFYVPDKLVDVELAVVLRPREVRRVPARQGAYDGDATSAGFARQREIVHLRARDDMLVTRVVHRFVRQR